uniref:hypothetical protein n=1 Tax=Nonomuraea sp. CA-252377 TaxID=3240003 RepID=UPI003F490BCC
MERPGRTRPISYRISAALDDARAYLKAPPPYGRIHTYPATSDRPDLVRAEGPGWSLIGELGDDPVAFILLDTAPEIPHPARAARTTALLHALSDMAHAQNQAAEGLSRMEASS